MTSQTMAGIRRVSFLIGLVAVAAAPDTVMAQCGANGPCTSCSTAPGPCFIPSNNLDDCYYWDECTPQAWCSSEPSGVICNCGEPIWCS